MRIFAALGIGLLLAGPAGAQTCRIALAMGLDVSSSVDSVEYRLQVEGLAAALMAPDVRQAFLGVPGEVVALSIFEWSGRRQQVVRQDWVAIGGPADLDRVAAGLLAQERSFDQYPTALGHAVLFGAEELGSGPLCAEQKLDISGDGTNNDGIAPPLAAPEAPITVNGLVIGVNRETLRRYYEAFVIRGPGAFVEMAESYEDFTRAMRRKLVRELGPGPMSALPPRGQVASAEQPPGHAAVVPVPASQAEVP